MNSSFMKLNVKDIARGLVMAVLAAVFSYLGTAIEGTVDWSFVFKVVVTTTLTYLSKNLISTEDGKVLGAIG